MIHASVELVEAMTGVHPGLGCSIGARGSEAYGERGASGTDTTYAFLYDTVGSIHTREDRDRVTCPACLLLMRSADPVRWDACEERGLNPKLETK